MALPAVFVVPFAALILAVSLLLLFYATWNLIGLPLSRMAGGVPLIGNDLRKAVKGIVEGITNTILGWVKSGVDGVVQIVSVPVNAFHEALSILAFTSEATIGKVGELGRATVGEIGQLGRTAANALTRTYANAAAVAGALSRILSLESLGSLLRYTLIPAAAAGALAASKLFTQGQVASERAARVQGIDNLRREAHDLALTNARGIDNLTERVIPQLRADVSINARGLERVRTDELPRIRTAVDENARAIDGVRSEAIPAAEARATARADAVGLELAAITARCITPTCNLFGPGSAFAGTLINEALWLALLGVVGQAMRDPQGTAQVTAELAGGLHAMGAVVLSPFASVEV